MSKQRKKSQTILSYCGDKEDQNIQPEEDNKAKAPTSKDSKKNMNQSQALGELKRDFEKQVREVEEKLRVTQENQEKQVNSLLKETQKNTEENNTLKNSLTQTAKEVQKANEEKNVLKSKIGQMEKEVQKITEENTSLKIRIEQLVASDFMRNQDTVKQIQKNEKLANNVKYLIGKTTDLKNRSRRENLKITGLSESHDQKKSLDIIFQEIIKENCPDILEPEGKIEIERIHQSPPERDPQRKTPRNIVAKFQSSQVKEKILQAARKKQFKYCGNTIRITQDLAASTLRDHRAWNIIFRRAKETGLQPRITYPAKLSIILQGEKWSFSEIEDFQAFLMKRLELNRKFDFQIQDSSGT
uniref:L1 transposable element RRM domain-containing protein n=1 Tax=Vombatus ursinus TaxID=29139 RepID=A0A4X2LHV5_VOMUR